MFERIKTNESIGAKRFIIFLLLLKKCCEVYVANLKSLHFDWFMKELFSETITKVLKLPQKVNTFKVVISVIPIV